MRRFEGKSATDIIDELNMQPIEQEGAYWAPGDRIDTMNCILALITNTPEGFSALHKLAVDEGWQWLAGDSVRMLLLAPDGSGREVELDENNSQVIVAREHWQGASTTGDWSLISCWCAPAFEAAIFTLGHRKEMQAHYPAFAHRIQELTRID